MIHVRGSQGTLTVDSDGYVVDYNPDDEAGYADIVRFNFPEYYSFWTHESNVRDFDILDLGFWTNTGEYVEPEHDWRQLTVENALNTPSWHPANIRPGTCTPIGTPFDVDAHRFLPIGLRLEYRARVTPLNVSPQNLAKAIKFFRENPTVDDIYLFAADRDPAEGQSYRKLASSLVAQLAMLTMDGIPMNLSRSALKIRGLL